MHKSILILTACTLSANLYATCERNDFQCADRGSQERSQQQYQQALQNERDRQQDQRNREYERQQDIERNVERNDQYWDSREQQTTAKDTLCIYTDCN